MANATSPVLPACWNDILENVRATLERADAEAARSAELLEATPVPALAQLEGTPWDVQLEAIDDHFRQLAASIARADLLAVDAANALEQTETALRQWLTHAAAIAARR